MNLLVTAGPTREFLDEVRFLSNLSSGRMGYAVAGAARRAGHAVTLISGPTDLPAPEGVARVDVESASEMLDALRSRWAGAEALVMAAAVADWRPALRMPGKMKKGGQEKLSVELVRTPDILLELSRNKGNRILIGFALETDGLLAEASRKMSAKSLDAVVANSLENLGSERASATVLTPDGQARPWTDLPKDEFGERLVALLAEIAAARKVA